jgi:hypothetical protein
MGVSGTTGGVGGDLGGTGQTRGRGGLAFGAGRLVATGDGRAEPTTDQFGMFGRSGKSWRGAGARGIPAVEGVGRTIRRVVLGMGVAEGELGEGLRRGVQVEEFEGAVGNPRTEFEEFGEGGPIVVGQGTPVQAEGSPASGRLTMFPHAGEVGGAGHGLRLAPIISWEAFITRAR